MDTQLAEVMTSYGNFFDTVQEMLGYNLSNQIKETIGTMNTKEFTKLPNYPLIMAGFIQNSVNSSIEDISEEGTNINVYRETNDMNVSVKVSDSNFVTTVEGKTKEVKTLNDVIAEVLIYSE